MPEDAYLQGGNLVLRSRKKVVVTTIVKARRSQKRAPLFPQVPAMGELGVRGID